jgi:hypothetical protein
LNRKKLIRRRKKMRQIEIERISERTGEGDRPRQSTNLLIGWNQKKGEKEEAASSSSSSASSSLLSSLFLLFLFLSPL